MSRALIGCKECRDLNEVGRKDISRLTVNPPKSQNSEGVRPPKSEYPTGTKSRNLIPPKSQFTERLFIWRSENPKSHSPELSILRRTVHSQVPSPGQSRKCHCYEFLFLRCPPCRNFSRDPAGFWLEPPRPTRDLARYPSWIPGRDVMPGNRIPVRNPRQGSQFSSSLEVRFLRHSLDCRTKRRRRHSRNLTGISPHLTARHFSSEKYEWYLPFDIWISYTRLQG